MRDMVESMTGRTAGRRVTDRWPLTSAEQILRLSEFMDATGVNLLTETGLAWLEYLSGGTETRPAGMQVTA